ncbi:hypothetical protein [Amycolatopsis thermophila]|uniref:Transmembrane protein n=1 Tax=Amycolatopsis thermophila TaxID=206084 RepID=A0ABU0ES22_9PSEU|nr:hypothetical protein [Amycolatopsis thermophila]MDQ0377949.1 hypothetical protein [Amycolatopsis thermophila]
MLLGDGYVEGGASVVGGLLVLVGCALVVASGGIVVPGGLVLERDVEVVGGAVTRVTSIRQDWSSGEHSTVPLTLQAVSTAAVAATAAIRAQVFVFTRRSSAPSVTPRAENRPGRGP